MTTLRQRYFSWRASLDGRTCAVLFAFLLLAPLPLLVGEVRVLLSPHRRATVTGVIVGFVILATILAVLLSALVRRRRWAWLVLLFLFGSTVVVDLFYFNGVVVSTLDVICFGLLASPSMRRYIKRANGSDRRQGPAVDGSCAG
jgi:biotin transporter BioY